ncbi:MAG TPA: phosphate ABC transporter permease subunit PstC, partial [Cellulomonas sp.]
MTSTQPRTVGSSQPGGAPAPGTTARRLRNRASDRGGSRVFRWLATSSGVLILVILAAVAVFLVLRALPAITADPADLAEEVSWFPDGTSLIGFVAPLVFGSLIAAALSLAIATPIAIGIALFISHYTPRRLSNALGYIVDLLAAIPSVVYGLWGGLVLSPLVRPVWELISHYLGWIPFFAGPASPTGRVMMTVGVVLAVMILPIITAICREVFLQTPRLH